MPKAASNGTSGAIGAGACAALGATNAKAPSPIAAAKVLRMDRPLFALRTSPALLSPALYATKTITKV